MKILSKKATTADRLAELMDEMNILQADIIRMAAPICAKYNMKLSRSDLSQYISGKTEPGQAKLTIIAEALGVSEAWLMGFDVQKHPSGISLAEPSSVNNSKTVYQTDQNNQQLVADSVPPDSYYAMSLFSQLSAADKKKITNLMRKLLSGKALFEE